MGYLVYSLHKSGHSDDCAKHKLGTCWDEISEETIHASCSQIPDRLRYVVKMKRGYIKN